MATETQNKQGSNAVRIQRDKMERAARVARMKSAKEDRRVSASAVLDEILDKGLEKEERKLGL